MTKAEQILKETLEIKGSITDKDYHKTVNVQDCLKAINKALNYTHGNTELKADDTLSFEKWLRKFKKGNDDCYWLNKNTLFCEEAMRLYYDDLPDK